LWGFHSWDLSQLADETNKKTRSLEPEVRRIAILGSTGSIGTSTLDVVAAHPERLSVVALAAGRNRELMLRQCERFRPACVSVSGPKDAAWLRSALSYAPEIHSGPEGLLACALHPDGNTVVAAVVGAAGLQSTEAALRAGRRVCVANKESLVVAGALMRAAMEAGGSELLPVDSEHAALHQLLDARDPKSIREVRITASGNVFGRRRIDEHVKKPDLLFNQSALLLGGIGARSLGKTRVGQADHQQQDRCKR